MIPEKPKGDLLRDRPTWKQNSQMSKTKEIEEVVMIRKEICSK